MRASEFRKDREEISDRWAHELQALASWCQLGVLAILSVCVTQSVLVPSWHLGISLMVSGVLGSITQCLIILTCPLSDPTNLYPELRKAPVEISDRWAHECTGGVMVSVWESGVVASVSLCFPIVRSLAPTICTARPRTQECPKGDIGPTGANLGILVSVWVMASLARWLYFHYSETGSSDKGRSNQTPGPDGTETP